MMPLSMAEIGEKKCIIKIRGEDLSKKYLENLGFTEGANVSVISEFDGNIIVSIKGTRVALSRIMANRIIV